MENFIDKLKNKGVKILNKAKKSIKDTKESISDTILLDKLKHRFNLENPHKFIVSEQRVKSNLIKEISAQNAKRYEEDNIFVFFGNNEANEFKPGFIVKDLKTMQDYIVKEVVEIEVPVEYKEKTYEVVGTALYTEEL
ncbi:MAG: hypothetical protein ACOCV1_00270 [Bacillota bacterium]